MCAVCCPPSDGANVEMLGQRPWKALNGASGFVLGCCVTRGPSHPICVL